MLWDLKKPSTPLLKARIHSEPGKEVIAPPAICHTSNGKEEVCS